MAKTTQILREKLSTNHHTAYVLSVEDLLEAAKEKKLEFANIALDNAATALDIGKLTKLVRELGFTGKVHLKQVKGKSYIIFKGLPGQRRIFTGTRYLSNNAKVLDMGIGSKAIRSSAISGARLTLFFTVPLVIIEHLLNDKFLLSELFADLTATLIKVGISTIVSAAAAVAFGTVTTIAAAPLAVAILVGLAVNWSLDKLDEKFGLTHKLAKMLQEMGEATLQPITRSLWKIEQQLRWQLINGHPVGKGIFYP